MRKSVWPSISRRPIWTHASAAVWDDGIPPIGEVAALPHIHIRVMTVADIPLGMRLKAQNAWNQLEADWRRFLTMEPDGCFVAEWRGTAVGTACTCTFDDVAWVAMVLVDA